MRVSYHGLGFMEVLPEVCGDLIPSASTQLSKLFDPTPDPD